MAAKLSEMQKMTVLSEAELKERMVVPENCRDLNEYLTRFDYPLELLQTEAGISFSVYELMKLQASQGLVYSEIRFAPQLHTRKGLSQKQVVQSALKGREAFFKEGNKDFQAGLILCCMRGKDNFKENIKTVETAGEFLGRGVVALDLAGAEALFPTENFEAVFRMAEREKIPFTIHAGEADGPKSIWKALEFGASRIGHGVRCLEDTVLTRTLADEGIPLELCPTSNMNTKIFKNITDYPILRFFDEGIKITINTDNMTVSGTTVRKELELISNTFHLDERQVDRLIQNAMESRFKNV
jgi:adenosine deaminase